MTRAKVWLVSFATFLLACCASAPAPRPYVAESSIIGISIEERAPIKLFHVHPDRVYFVRLDGDHSLFQTQIIPSNYTSHGRIYLLNVRPGQYAAVGTLTEKTGAPPQRRSTTYTAYFAKELIEDTKVTVGPGEIVFMGDYVVDLSVGLGAADELQSHYAQLIDPGTPRSGLSDILSGEYHYRGVMHEKRHDDESRLLFLKDAKVDLAASGWASVFN